MQAAPVLLRRLLHEEHQRYDWQVDPKHTMKVWGLHKLRQNLPKFIEHLRGKSCHGSIILLDLEDHLPCEEAPALAEEIARLQPLPFPVVIVFACKEYEAWFLAGIASIAAHSAYFADILLTPTTPRLSVALRNGWTSKCPPLSNTKRYCTRNNSLAIWTLRRPGKLLPSDDWSVPCRNY